jgi:Ca-activated chloride channel family protein
MRFKSLTLARSLLLFCSLLILGLSPRAQMPTLKTGDKNPNSVYLQQLAVDVKIAGTLATTTWTMTFKNKTNRILEGELNFPLPAGISVSRYALDINGKMREAVPVAKDKGTLLFENVERRRVDPGILEKVDGNTFRTRIYPINPNGIRTVLIAYEQDLSGDTRDALRYNLPLSFQNPIETFAIEISVIHSTARPVFEENADDALQFKEWKDNWSASRRWQNYMADRSLAIRVPISPGAAEAMMQQKGNHYFYTASIFLQPKRIERVLPHHITLLWDASLSGLSRNKKKELALLDAYFGKIGNATLALVNFSNTAQEPRQFSIANGEWHALRTALENTTFDGATQFGALRLEDYPCDEFLLFSDGHSNFGSSDIHLANTPVYAIVAAPGADYPFLQSIADRSGGEVINLENTGPDPAKDQLLYQSLQFLGVKPAAGLEESYPSTPTSVTGNITVAGISYQPVQQVVLQFGYGGKVTIEQPVSLDFSRQETTQPDLSRVWAQKKIAQLDIRYEDNKTEIEQLGRRYCIVTRNTSLIVLESLNDYITYRIEPPADLRDEYDRIMKQRGDNDFQTRRMAVNNAETYFNELLDWWKGSKPATPAKHPSPRVLADTTPVVRYVQPETRALEGRAAGVAVNSAQPHRGQYLDEVVVVGYGARRKKDVTASISTYREDEDNTTFFKAPASPGHSPLTPGNGSFSAALSDLKTDYLQQLKAASPADRYTLYLQLRKNHLNTPLFYFNTASLFLATGQKATGIKILSNIAELETESYELYKMLGYKLKELGEAEAACTVFKKVIEWRPFEPQSYRDYGLALEDAGHYQQALDTLCFAMTKNYDESVNELYPGIEETLLPEINEIIGKGKGKLDLSRIPKNLVTNMPVDIRVVLNWNRSNTDIDLWVTDPDNEKCYYAHRSTEMGGRISHDFTRGLGPEQFLLKRAVKGSYKVEVNYFGDTQVALAGETTIMAEVYTNYGTPQQHRSIITLQMQRGAQGAVYVGEFDFK